MARADGMREEEVACADGKKISSEGRKESSLARKLAVVKDEANNAAVVTEPRERN